jgi:LDH2 family malate/lactate/ureidoglycolate dehydrogenase
MRIKLDELRKVTKEAIRQNGYDDAETEVILDVLLFAQLRGNNQGIVKLVGQGMPKSPKAGDLSIVRQTTASALIDGNHNPGMVVLKRAVNMVLEKAQETGFGIVGTFNTGTSTGALGYYARELALEDYIGFVFAGSPPTVCACGSFEPIFGTNPVAIGVPTDTEPIVLDMATAALAWYGLVEAKTAGRCIPERLAYDSSGEFTTDPAKAMEGAILPFDGGHKGSGLAMMIEILTGPLVSASFAGVGDVWGNWGNLVYAIDPGLLVDKQAFKRNVSDLVTRVRNGKRTPGTDAIYAPGDRGNFRYRRAVEEGEVEIEDELLSELQKVVASR